MSNNLILVDIDETKILQVVSNLISNALKFTHENGVIGISIEEEEKAVLIKVSDIRIGIPSKYHAGLFKKFTPAKRLGLQGEPSHGLGVPTPY